MWGLVLQNMRWPVGYTYGEGAGVTDREMQKKIAELLGWKNIVLWGEKGMGGIHPDRHLFMGIPNWQHDPAMCERDLIPLLIKQRGWIEITYSKADCCVSTRYLDCLHNTPKVLAVGPNYSAAISAAFIAANGGDAEEL